MKGGIPLLGGAEGGVEQLWKRDNQENKTLHDFIYSRLELILIKEGILKDVSEDSRVLTGDYAGFVNSLSSTEFLLFDSFVELRDYSRILKVLAKFNDLGKAVARMSIPKDGKTSSQIQKEWAAHMASGRYQMDKDIVSGLILIIEEFIGQKILLLVRPFDDFECDFVGVVNPTLLREEMGNVLLKFGSMPSERWRVCCQVASLKPSARNDQKDEAGDGLFKSFAKVFQSVRGMDSVIIPYGKNDISITPLAIYLQSLA